MGHRTDSVVFLAGNLTEGFQAHGPYCDHDDCAAAHDSAEGWMLGVEAPGQLVSLKLFGVSDEAEEIGEYYFPRDLLTEEIQERVQAVFSNWAKTQPATGRQNMLAFAEELATHFSRAPEALKVEVDIE